MRELKLFTVKNSNHCSFCQLHQFTLLNLAKQQSLLPCTLVRIAGCPAPSALLHMAGCPTLNALLHIDGSPALNALLHIAGCPTASALLRIARLFELN